MGDLPSSFNPVQYSEDIFQYPSLGLFMQRHTRIPLVHRIDSSTNFEAFGVWFSPSTNGSIGSQILMDSGLFVPIRIVIGDFLSPSTERFARCHSARMGIAGDSRNQIAAIDSG